MSNIPVYKNRAKFSPELSINTATLTGGYDLIGTLTQNPVMIVFQNDSNVSVGISDDGTTTGMTLVAGTKVVFDLRAAHGMASNFSWDIGTNFYAIGAAGAGLFKITVIYAR